MARRVTSLTESGILAGLTVVMALTAMYVPLLGVVAVLLWPLPMVMLYVRHGLRWALMAVFTATVITAAIVEPIAALRLVITFAPTGLALGFGYRRKLSGVQTFMLATAASIIAKAAGLYVVFLLTGVEPFSGQIALMPEQFEQSVETYRAMGMSEAQIEAARENFNGNMQMMKLLFPLLVLMMGIMDTALNFWLGGKLLRRFGEDVPTFPPFTEWRISGIFLYMYAFSAIGMYWGRAHDVPLLFQAAVNAQMVSMFAGLLAGLSVYRAACAHYKVSSFLSNLVLIFAALVGFVMQLLAFTGLLDPVFDYRKRFGWGEKATDVDK